jgi:flagellar biosynthesis/type III secretory pathway ATPase
MKTRIHVNQHNIRANLKNGESSPVITVKDYKDNRKTNKAEIVDANGNVVAAIVYRPDKPLSCGARVWIETELEVTV